jgi:GTPase
MSNMFVDRVVVNAKAGNGGSGIVSFRREKFIPMGGPDGGDGGRGGDVVVVGDTNLATLLDYTYRDSWRATDGDHGSGSNKTGRAGEDVIMPVPVGTVIRDLDTEERLGEVLEDGDRLIVARGGRGGKGNAYFVSSTHQSPREYQPGEDGQTRRLELELKLIADVGLVGQPNAGKSTLLSVISAARPKIADYPFTTLAPNLGVVQLSGDRNFVIADIPGLIEGAAEGAGLGHQFLRHVERCRALLHIVEDTFTTGDERDPLRDYDTINRELARYAPELAAKPQIVALNKIDAGTHKATVEDHVRAFAARGIELHTISAATGEGVAEILELLWPHVASGRAPVTRA